MENLIFDKWIELGGGRLGFLNVARKQDDENMLLLLLEKTERAGAAGNSEAEPRTIQLVLQGRKVTAENGTQVDFGTAYPIATEQGKITITKQFMKAFLG